MNSTTLKQLLSRSKHGLTAGLLFGLLLVAPVLHAQSVTPTLPGMTYTIDSSGYTGKNNKYYYQIITFTLSGYSNVDPIVLQNHPDAYVVYSFNNSSFEDQGGIVTPVSMPPNWVFSDVSDFTVGSTSVGKGIFATDPLDFTFATDFPSILIGSDGPPILGNQPITLTTTDPNGNPGNTITVIPTFQAVPEVGTGTAVGLLLALVGVGLGRSAWRRRHAVDRS